MLLCNARSEEAPTALFRRELDGYVRAELELSSDTITKKIRNASNQKIPNVLIVGEREVTDGTVTLRRLGVREQETMPVAQFVERITTAIKRRQRTPL